MILWDIVWAKIKAFIVSLCEHVSKQDLFQEFEDMIVSLNNFPWGSWLTF